MHEAYEFSQILKLAVQIESIASYDDKLVVGSKQGHLFLYSVTKEGGVTSPSLICFNKGASKKPVQELAVIPEYDLLIKLSDNLLCLHELSSHNFSLIKALNRTKGATLFSLDVKNQRSLTGEEVVTVRMCVVVKRKLQLYYLKNRDFLELGKDISLPDVPRAISWYDQMICIGFKSSYSLVEVNGEVTELFPPGKYCEPSVTKMSDKCISLGKDTESVLMKTKHGTTEPIIYSSVKWSELPIAIGCDEPYLLALLSKKVEVEVVGRESSEEKVEVLSPAIEGKLISRAGQGLLYVASAERVWVLQAVPIPKQIKLLLKEKHFELALKLANISDDSEEEKHSNILKIQTLYAFDLFHNKKFAKAMREFLKLKTDPYEVIQLFPSLVPEQVRQPQAPQLVDRDLENGILALISYLTEVRLKLHVKEMGEESKSTLQLMQIIDTTLLKCYLQTNDAMVAPVLRRNYCNLEEAERTLKRYLKYPELIILYQTKGLHQKGLSLLRSQADVADSPLRGIDRTIHYLQNLGKEHIELILEYAGWVLERSPEEGLKIFTEDMAEVEQLPRPKVLDYLLRTNNHSLVIPYLEHVIYVWKETNSIVHNALVHEYREKMKELGPTEVPLLRAKLINFLEKSPHYSPETVLIHFPTDSLFEERAIINGKLGRHEHALSIYVRVLGNYKRAVEYCGEVWSREGGANCGVYVELVRLLVEGGDLETALALLDAHSLRVPPLPALAILPPTVPLSRLSHFLSSSLTHHLDSRRTNQLLKGLLYAIHLQVQEVRMKEESKSVPMTEYNVCPVCKKRFANQSAFVRYPNGKIVHYSCQEKVM